MTHWATFEMSTLPVKKKSHYCSASHPATHPQSIHRLKACKMGRRKKKQKTGHRMATCLRPAVFRGISKHSGGGLDNDLLQTRPQQTHYLPI